MRARGLRRSALRVSPLACPGRPPCATEAGVPIDALSIAWRTAGKGQRRTRAVPGRARRGGPTRFQCARTFRRSPGDGRWAMDPSGARPRRRSHHATRVPERPTESHQATTGRYLPPIRNGKRPNRSAARGRLRWRTRAPREAPTLLDIERVFTSDSAFSGEPGTLVKWLCGRRSEESGTAQRRGNRHQS